MATTDTAVRWNGKIYRLVATDQAAGLFDKAGTLTTLQVTAPASAHGRLPMVSLNGAAVTLQAASRPCSCTGGIWRETARTLRERLA